MEPLDENELKRLLRQWEAPQAPRTLKQRVLPQQRPRWNWLLRGTVRVPVPVAIAIALVVGLWGLWVYHSRPAGPPQAAVQPGTVSLIDIKPVR